MVEQKPRCDDCIHKSVCAYKNEYSRALNTIFNMTFNIGDNKPKMLKMCEWVEHIRIDCKYYKPSENNLLKAQRLVHGG